VKPGVSGNLIVPTNAIQVEVFRMGGGSRSQAVIECDKGQARLPADGRLGLKTEDHVVSNSDGPQCSRDLHARTSVRGKGLHWEVMRLVWHSAANTHTAERIVATLEKVQTQIAKLQAQADALIKKQSSAVIGKIRDLMEKHGLTVADIDTHAGGKRHGRKPGSKAAVSTTTLAKYRDPKTGATWTGHGRAPAWIAGAKDRTKFLTDGSVAQAAAAVPKTTSKTGNYVRGPQAAKYRDPKSDATWSGRGRAPAWLAGAKDRSKFLIASVEEGATASKPAPAKTAGTKKTTAAKVAKKVVAKKSKAVAKAPSTKKAAVKRAPAKKAVAKKVVASEATKNPAAAPIVEAASTEAS
jgi:DNA-binding protein H-NS